MSKAIGFLCGSSVAVLALFANDQPGMVSMHSQTYIGGRVLSHLPVYRFVSRADANILLQGAGGVGTAAPVGPFPATQTVAFGGKTPDLFGGSPMQYSTQGALGVSRWLKITAMTNKNGTNIFGTPIFQLDDRYFLDPLEPSNNTYGHAWTHGADCNTVPYCSVTVTEYSNAGMTTPTGFSSVITVRTDAAPNAYTLRENTSAANSCVNPITQVVGQNCEVTNPDASGGSNNQIGWVWNLALNRDTDSVIFRDGYFDPLAKEMRIQVGTSWTGTGTIVMSSETKDIGTVDSYGNPRYANGFIIGGLLFDSFGWGDIFWPVQFDYVQFKQNVAAPEIANVGFNRNDLGYGVTITHSRLTAGCSLVTPLAKIQFNSMAVVNDNTFDSCAPKNGGVDTGVNFSIAADAFAHPSFAGLTALRNVFETPSSDAIHVTECNVDIEFNYIFGEHEVNGGHADTFQNQGVETGVAGCAVGTISYNIVANGPADTSGFGPQGIPFLKNDQGTALWVSATIHDNMNLQPNDSNCQFFWGVNNITATGNANIWSPQTTTPIAPGQCSFSVATAGTNGTFVGNVNNSFDISLQGGTIVNTHNLPITWSNDATGCNAIKAKFSNFVCGDNPLDTNRAYSLDRMKPGNRSDTANGDGTFFGPIWPQLDNAQWCFAVSATVVNFAGTCVSNGTIALQ